MTTKVTVGSVLDTCNTALSSLSPAERDQVILSLLAIHPPRGMKKLVGTLAPASGNATSQRVLAPSTGKTSSGSVAGPASSKGKKKTAPPQAKAWGKDPAYLALKQVQADAAKALTEAKASAGLGKDESFPTDHHLVVKLNSARTACQNFRPQTED